MEIVISVLAVVLAFACLIALLMSGAKDRKALRERRANQKRQLPPAVQLDKP